MKYFLWLAIIFAFCPTIASQQVVQHHATVAESAKASSFEQKLDRRVRFDTAGRTACILGGSHSVGATTRSSAIQTHVADAVKPSQTVKPERKTNQIAFKSVLMRDGIADGSRMYFTRYESSNKHLLYETWIYFDSPSKAGKKIRELLSSPLKKLRESPEIDKNRKQVGKRVLVVRQSASEVKTQAILAWNEGARYQEIRSDSLEDVLAFEDQYRRPAKQDTGPLGTLHIPGHGNHESEVIPISSPK